MIDEPILCIVFHVFSLLIISWDIGQAMFPQSVGTPTYHSDPVLNMMWISRMASWRNTCNTPSVHDRSANMMAHGKKKIVAKIRLKIDDGTCFIFSGRPWKTKCCSQAQHSLSKGKNMCYNHERMKGMDICGQMIGITFRNHFCTEWRGGKHVVQHFLWKDCHCLILGVLEYWGPRQNIAIVIWSKESHGVGVPIFRRYPCV